MMARIIGIGGRDNPGRTYYNYNMLYIVGTPIGNLEDITFRAVSVLRAVEKIYCEDTRRTKVLCDRYTITTPLESFHQHSAAKIEKIIGQLKQGIELAYVSDAGTPGIQDPGGQLVQAARAAGILVVPIPGPSAVTTLLSVAGIPTDNFRFAGYVPTKKGRQTFLKSLLAAESPVVFFETPHRFHKLLTELEALGGVGQELIVGRELTKKFEQIVRGTPAELREIIKEPLGEFVLVTAPR